MAKAKLDVQTLMTLAIGAAALGGGATYIAKLGAGAEQNLPEFFSQLRWIMLIAATAAFVASLLLSRRLDDLAARTEAQRRYPPEGVAQLPNGVADPCDGEPALMVAANLRGYALMATCFGIAAGLAGLLFALPF